MSSRCSAVENFQFCGTWVIDVDGEKDPEGNPLHVIDQATGKRYYNDPKLRNKMFMYATIPCDAVVSAGYAGIRVVKLISCYHCWPEHMDYEPVSPCELPSVVEGKSLVEEDTAAHHKTCEDQVKAAAMDVVKLVAMPIFCLGKQAAACWGCCFPNDGRKAHILIAANEGDGEVSDWDQKLLKHSELI